MKKRTLHDSKAYDSYWNEKLLGWWMLILYTAKVSNNEVGVSSMSQKLGLHRDLNILFSHFFLLLAPLMWSSKALSSGCEHKPLSFLLCGRNSHWRQSWFKVMGIAFWFFFFIYLLHSNPTFLELVCNCTHFYFYREKKTLLAMHLLNNKVVTAVFFLFHIFFTLKKKIPKCHTFSITTIWKPEWCGMKRTLEDHSGYTKKMSKRFQ